MRFLHIYLMYVTVFFFGKMKIYSIGGRREYFENRVFLRHVCIFVENVDVLL